MTRWVKFAGLEWKLSLWRGVVVAVLSLLFCPIVILAGAWTFDQVVKFGAKRNYAIHSKEILRLADMARAHPSMLVTYNPKESTLQFRSTEVDFDYHYDEAVRDAQGDSALVSGWTRSELDEAFGLIRNAGCVCLGPWGGDRWHIMHPVAILYSNGRYLSSYYYVVFEGELSDSLQKTNAAVRDELEMLDRRVGLTTSENW